MTQENRSRQLAQAAYNNALWCDTVCRAHGVPGEFGAAIWFNRYQTPPYYPNAVTLSPTAGTQTPQALYDLLTAALPAQGAVKDSFCALDLTPLGYTQLFAAEWIWRAPTQAKPEHPSGIAWQLITDAQALSHWERAWQGQPSGVPSTTVPRLFLPVLLAEPTVRFLAAYQGAQLVAGAIASLSDGVVGLSNLFYTADAAATAWAGCVATIMALYPALPIVGYERDQDLVLAQTLGFDAIGPLRVWARG